MRFIFHRLENMKNISAYIRQRAETFFAESLEEGIFLDADDIKKICSGNPKAVDAYIEIFGIPEEA